MKKLVILFVLLALSAMVLTAADTPAIKGPLVPATPNGARIAELSKAHAEILSQIQQAQQFIQQKQAEAFRIEGAVSELERQDAESAAKNKPAETPSK